MRQQRPSTDARLSLLESTAHVVNPSNKVSQSTGCIVIFLLITCSLLPPPALIIGAKHRVLSFPLKQPGNDSNPSCRSAM